MVEQQNATVGLLQDLKNLFVYWDFSPERINTLNDFLTHVKPHMKICLRLIGFNRNHTAYSTIEREVFLERLEASGCYYFYGVNPNHNYRFELGGKEPNGNFVLFSRSSAMELHPSHQNPAPIGLRLLADLNWDDLIAAQPSSNSY